MPQLLQVGSGSNERSADPAGKNSTDPHSSSLLKNQNTLRTREGEQNFLKIISN